MRKITIEDSLDILNALIFIGALIYFIATVTPALVSIGGDQQFCRCTPATFLTATSNTNILCVASVVPTTEQQISGQFTRSYFNLVNHTDFYVQENIVGFKPDCTLADVARVNLPINDKNLNLHFPSKDDSIFPCVSVRTTNPPSLEFYANLTTDFPLMDADVNGIIPIGQVRHFETPTFKATTFAFLNQPATNNAMETGFGECILKVDETHWQSFCICPLNVIGNALAIASITFLFFYPVKLIKIMRGTNKRAREKDEDAVMSA